MPASTQAERQGIAQRSHCGRSSLAGLPARKFAPLEVLKEAAKDHIAHLLPVKFKLMSESPFAFFRGSVEIMAADLGAAKNTRIEVQLCGDAHVKNFGFFATPAAEIVLDINDFDETQRGPWEWDVKRLATSIILAGRVARVREHGCKDAVHTFVDEYCEWVRRFARMPAIEVARHRIVRDFRDPAIRSALKKAERSSPLSSLQKLTHKNKDGSYVFNYQRDSVWEVKGAEYNAIQRGLAQYRATLQPDRQFLFDRYTVEDIGFKVVGTGSVGTRDYIVLLLGRDRREKDPLLLQVKEEQPSAYAAYYPDGAAPRHQGERVVLGQRGLQVFSDILLGWCSIDRRDYLVRQLNDHKSSVEPAELKGRLLLEYARVCAELLAKGHARSGEPAVLAGYLGNPGKAERALTRYAAAYADQAEKDYETFRKALQRGFTREAMKIAQQ
jgi:uncharacterized protein (DUF2252 family)